jgi:chemotaxis signal transduction protein
MMAFSIPAHLGGAQAARQRLSSQYHSSAGATAQTAVATQPAHVVSERGAEFLTFSCDGIACATPLGAIREALMTTPAIASLPDSPDWFLGVFQLRAEIMGAADIRPLVMGQEIVGEGALAHELYPALTGRERAIIVGTGAQSLAFLVESIGDILSLRPHEILRDLVEHPAFGAIAPRYRLGLLAPDGHTTRFALVALDALLVDMLTALTDPEVAAYA